MPDPRAPLDPPETQPPHSPALPFGDEPITEQAQDLLGRTRISTILADEIAAMNAHHGAVVGIIGPWGSGKTSVMNLTAAQLRQQDEIIGVVDFNPWLFAGAEELASYLLSELAAQLTDMVTASTRGRARVADIAATMKKYSDALDVVRVIPGLGAVKTAVDASIEGAGSLARGDTSLTARRKAVVDALDGLEGRVVVLVDDIDRLSKNEILDLFRTVRLTASFPNVIYLLCLDRQVVEHALEEEGLSGRTTSPRSSPSPVPSPNRQRTDSRTCSFRL